MKKPVANLEAGPKSAAVWRSKSSIPNRNLSAVRMAESQITFLTLLFVLLTSVFSAPAFAGSIVAWGSNGSGQCNAPSPNTGFVAIASGRCHTLGLKSNGSIVAWGLNGYGQCNIPSPNSGFITIAAGWDHSLGLKKDGSIVAWGWNDDGQRNIPSSNIGFIAIAAGMYHSLGLKHDGSIVAWGRNDCGECNIPSPNTGFIAIAAGGGHSLGLKQDGSIVAWGRNDCGQCNIPSPNTGFVAVAAGHCHSLGLKRNGSIVAWGDNGNGQCDIPSPNNGFLAVAGGGFHSLGLKSNGSIVAWGKNYDGQCNIPSPNSGFIAIAAGWYHSLGLNQDGSTGTLIIYPSQSYQSNIANLSLVAVVIDTLYGEVKSGIFTWLIRDYVGTQKASGSLTYNTSTARWTASQTVNGGLPPGNYMVQYNIITNRGRIGSAVSNLTVAGAPATIRGTIRDTIYANPLEGVTVHLYDAYAIWQMAIEHFNGTIPSLSEIMIYITPVREATTSSDGLYQWQDILPGSSYVVYATKTGYLARYTESFPVRATDGTIVKDLDLPNAVNTLAALWPEFIGNTDSLEDLAKDRLDLNAEWVAEVARKVNEDELFKIDPVESGFDFLKEVYIETGTGIADKALLEPFVQWISKEWMQQAVVQVIKNRLSKWAEDEVLKLAAKAIGTLLERAISGKALDWTQAIQYRQSALFDKADENLTSAHTRFEQNVSMTLDNNIVLDRVRIALRTLRNQYASRGGKGPIAILVPLDPQCEVQVFMLETNRNAYFQISELRKLLKDIKEITTNIQIVASTAQITAGGMALVSGGIASPASAAIIAGAQTVKETVRGAKILSKWGSLGTEFILIYMWGNVLAATVEDSDAIADSFRTAVELLIDEAQNPVYFHKGHNYNGVISLDLNLFGDVPILWKMPFVPVGIGKATVQVSNTGNVPANYRMLSSGFWSPGEVIGRPFFSLPTCFDGLKTFYLEPISSHAESVTYLGYDLGFVGLLSAHHLLVDLYAGPFYVDHDEESFWVLDPLSLVFPLSSSKKSTQRVMSSCDFSLSVADGCGNIGPAHIEQKISASEKLVDTFLSAAMPSVTAYFSPEPNIHVGKLDVFAPPETLVSILVVDEDGRRLGYSSTDGIIYSELCGIVTNIDQRPASVALLEPSGGMIYSIMVELLTPSSQDAHVEVFYEPVRQSGALMRALPSPVILDGYRGTKQSMLLRLAEASGQQALTDVNAVLCTIEKWGGGIKLPFLSDVNQTVGDIPAGEQRYVSWDVNYPRSIDLGKYVGAVTISSNETADLTIPVVSLVRHTRETVSLYEGPGPNTATIQKSLTLWPDVTAETWVHIPRGYHVVYAAMGVVGASANLQNPSIDIGTDGSFDWAFSGKFDLGVLVNNIEDAFNCYLSSHPAEANGVDVPIRVTANAGETILLNGIQLYLDSILGDCEPDGDVDWSDMGEFASHWLDADCNEPDWCDKADLNKSGSVDLTDLAAFAESWLWQAQP